MTQAYPLQWPGRPRTPDFRRKNGQFNKKVPTGRGWSQTKSLTVADAMGRLQDEIDRLGVTDYVLSTNVALRLDGRPRSGEPKPDDPGVCLYFTLKGKPHALPCDTYHEVADNIAAIAKHIEATRAIERYGVSTIAEMFTGFVALPGSGARPWAEVLGLADAGTPIDRAAVDAAFRRLARERHPDHGGSDAMMAELNRAKAEALADLQP